MGLVNALVRIQQNAGMTDEAFAETLGIPRSTWNGYKRGSPISLPFVQIAVDKYPQVKEHAERLLFGLESQK
jgi:hypothetical protein